MKKRRSVWHGRSVLALVLVLLMLGGTGVLAAGRKGNDREKGSRLPRE